MVNILPPYAFPGGPVPFVTPFTYRDGASFLERFQDLRNYVNKVVVPYVNENTAGLATTFEEQVNVLIGQVNAALTDQTEEVDQKIADLTTYVNNAVQQIIDDSIEVQDPVVAALVADTDSDTYEALQAFMGGFATQAQVDTIQELIDTGRLSQDELDERYLANILDWEGPWVTATAYGVNDAVSINGSSYIAKVAHTSGSTTQPGIGGAWATVWDLLASKGDPGQDASAADLNDIKAHFAPQAFATPLTGSLKTGNIANGTKTSQVVNSATYNAFPALALTPSGILVSVWRQAPHHDVDYPGDIFQSRSFDFGVTWETPYAIKTDTLDVRDPGITTLKDGRLVLIYRTTGPNMVDKKIYISYSTDDGVTWGSGINVPFTFNAELACATNVLELSNGTLLVTAYGNNVGQSFRSTRTIMSSNGGTTWSGETTVANGVTDSKDYNEAVMQQLPNGDVRILVRCDTGTKTIYRSTSTNGGTSWGALATVIVGGGKPSWIRLKSGAHLLIYRRNSDWSFEYVTSWDEGITWTAPALFAEIMTGGLASAYADPIELSPGLIGVIYSEETIDATNAYVRFKYMADGIGISPLGDFFKGNTGDTSGATERFVSATEFAIITNTPALGPVNALTPGWAFDQATAEAIGATIKLPSTWLTFNIVLAWAPGTTGTGGVRWQVITRDVVAGAVLGGNNEQYDVTSAAPGVAWQVVNVTAKSAQVNRNNPISFRVVRAAADGADTFATDAYLFGVWFVKAS